MQVTHEQRLHFPKNAVVSQEGVPNSLLVTQNGKRLTRATFQGDWTWHQEHTNYDLVVVIKFYKADPQPRPIWNYDEADQLSAFEYEQDARADGLIP
jgi:hypothetical protein